MYCEKCQDIPLDLFLPTKFKRDNKRWIGRIQYSKDLPDEPTAYEKLKESASNGCGMCELIKSALDNANSDEDIGAPVRPRNMGLNLSAEYDAPYTDRLLEGETGIVLTLVSEGIIHVLNGDRVGKLSWGIPSMNSGYTRSRPIAERPLTPQVVQQCNKWLDQCEQDHEFCRQSSANFIPEYLVEIEGEGQFAKVRLVNIDSASGGKVKYTTLSYCWGHGRGFIPTLKTNVSERRTAIPARELCQTFLDAIRLTTELGLQHIWIDALCILQDDQEHRESQWTQMNSIFKGAHVTLAAANADNGQRGFLRTRDPLVAYGHTYKAKNKKWVVQSNSIMSGNRGRYPGNPDEAEVTLFPVLRPWLASIQGPLTKRGWALQERELSPRMLHFTTDRVLWECRECIAAEEEPDMLSKAEYNKTILINVSPMRALDSDGRNTATDIPWLPAAWTKLMRDYSRRKLSIPQDKLVAIAGLAREFAGYTKNDQYLAGNWQSELLETLAWFPDDSITGIDSAVSDKAAARLSLLSLNGSMWPSDQSDNNTPSWSWVSYSGAIWFWGSDWFVGGWQQVVLDNGETKYEKRNDSAKIIKASVDRKKEGSYGPVKGGSLQISGQAIEIELSENDHDLELSKGWIRKIYAGPIFPRSRPQVMEAQRRRALELAGMELYAPPVPSQDDTKEEEDGIQVPKSSVYVYFDDAARTPSKGKFLCLKLGTGKPPRGGKPDKDCGIVLVQSEQASGAYQRVGMFDVERSENAWLSQRKVKEVTIV